MYSAYGRPRNARRQGFTIVELLIVIVVIAILAAIILIAFNGIQRRASETTLVTSLRSAGQVLETDRITSSNDNYPGTQAEANAGRGFDSAQGVRYQYTSDNSALEPTFCLSASFRGLDYFMTDNSQPAEGVCDGHYSSEDLDQTLTNLSPNPSVESDDAGWTDSRAVCTRDAAAAKEGKYGLRCSVDDAGYFPRVVATTAAVEPGVAYTFSAWVKSSGQVRIGYGMNSGNQTAGTLVDSNGQWVRVAITTPVMPAGTSTAAPWIGVADGAAVGTEFDVDGVMITSGPTQYGFADGNSAGWTWQGAMNNSVSSGPASSAL